MKARAETEATERTLEPCTTLNVFSQRIIFISTTTIKPPEHVVVVYRPTRNPVRQVSITTYVQIVFSSLVFVC